MTDNRTSKPNQNETKSGQGFCFTEAQVEAAAKALHETRNPWFAAHGAWGAAGFEIKQAFRESARAALVAAQGAAPQAESVPKSSYISPSLPGMIRNLWKSDPSENSVRTALKLAGDLIQELIDLKASPVLPSSGVDEDAVADAIAAHSTWYTRNPHTHEAWQGCTCGERLPSGVAKNDWHASHQARAVVEAIGGESRGEG